MKRSFSASSILAVSSLVVGAASSSGACSGDSDPRTDDGHGDAGTDASLDGDAAVDDAGAADDADAAGESDASHDAGPTYQNPIFAQDFPDPFVLRIGSSYFAFATNASGKNVRTARSQDLTTWTEGPDALPVLPSWAQANASLTWAPSVLPRGNQYVLYFTARNKASGFQCIGRAVSTTPEGPYVDDTSAPFLCQDQAPNDLCGSIDPSPFVDENGDPYILWKSDENAAQCQGNTRLWSQRMGIDGLSLLGSPAELLQRDRGWESPLIEGPAMLKDGSQYYLFYSANWWESEHYGIGYATCSSPSGPCEKKTLNAPFITAKDAVQGPGGQEFFTDTGGKRWMSYHAWTSPKIGYSNGGARSLRIDPIEFQDGAPVFTGPSVTPRPL